MTGPIVRAMLGGIYTTIISYILHTVVENDRLFVSNLFVQSGQFILFQLSGEWFVLPIDLLRGIERWRTPTPVPGTPASIVGIINQRGALMTVLDTRMLLGLKTEPPTRRTRLLLVRINDLDLALVVDHVADMLPLDVTRVEPAPGRSGSLSTGLIPTPLGWASMLNVEAALNVITSTF